MRLKIFSLLLGPTLFLVIILMVVLSIHTSNKSNKIFGNTTYYFDNVFFTRQRVTAKLVDGEYRDSFLRVSYENKYAYGDFNHDGLKDAAVIISENTGGNQDWYVLIFLINDGKRLVHRFSIDLDDRAIINSLREKNGGVFIDMYVHNPGDSMGGPTKRVKNIYQHVPNDGLSLTSSHPGGVIAQ